MNESIENREKQKVYQVVNKYYYDIESSLIYFETYNIFKQKRKSVLSVLLLLALLGVLYHLYIIIFINTLHIKVLDSHNLYSGKISLWIGYVIFLAIYVALLIVLEIKKTGILYKEYDVKDLKKIQELWISRNLPDNVNKFKLVEANRNWLGLLGKINNENNIKTGYVLDNGIISKLISVMTPFLLIAFSFKFLGTEFDKVAKEYPTETISLLIGILSMILISIPVFFMVKNFVSRIFSAIDHKNSKSSYRFNIFNRMLLHHVTLKEFDESFK